MNSPALNDFQVFLRETRGCEVYYMNLAQDRAIISDNAITAAEVYAPDAATAVTRIMGRDLAKVLKWLESGHTWQGASAQ